MNAFAVMFVYAFAQHKQRSMTLSIILLFMGVQTQLAEIRISLGGSALFAVYLLCSWASGQKMVSIYEKQKEKQIASAGDDVGPVSAYDCTTRRVTWAVRQRRQS